LSDNYPRTACAKVGLPEAGQPALATLGGRFRLGAGGLWSGSTL